MSDRPILFSGPMVRALHAGTKTQTRRAVKGLVFDADSAAPEPGNPGTWLFQRGKAVQVQRVRCPYGVPGDRLWVRESVAAGRVNGGGAQLRYPSDGAIVACAAEERWLRLHHYDETRRRLGSDVPSIHMPRWASRLTLEITDVRVERLQDISEPDAAAEGIADLTSPDGARGVNVKVDGEVIGNWIGPRNRDIYETLWEHINGAGSWAANPWVWAASFSVHHGNIGEAG